MEDHEIDRSLEGVVSREIGYLFYYFHHRQALSYELHYFQNTFYISKYLGIFRDEVIAIKE